MNTLLEPHRYVSLSWFLFLTVPVALLIFFKTHRTKAKEEALFLADRLPKNAPVLLFASICAFSLLILHSCNVISEASRLEGQLSIATNPPPALLETNKSLITLSDRDVAMMSDAARKFASSFTKTNGHPPKVTFVLYQNATQSRHLIRQLKDCFDQAGWTCSVNKGPMLNPINQGIVILAADINHPSSEMSFWVDMLIKCSIQYYPQFLATGPLMDPKDTDSVVIVVNDPDYFE